MKVEPFDAEAYVAAAARGVGLQLSAAERSEVASQLERIHGFARLLFECELGPDDEIAPRFEP